MRTVCLLLSATCLFSVTLNAAPRYPNQGQGYYDTQQGYQEQQQNSPMKDLLLNLRHQVTNQEAELRTIRERLDNQEHIIDSVREDAEKLQAVSREVVKSHGEVVETKVANIVSNHDHLGQDLQQLQHYANSVKELLEQYHSRLQGLETAVDHQSKNLKSLETAVQSLLEAFPAAEKPVAVLDNGEAVYRVVDGDTLEKIARRNNTTIRKVKELNGLTTDRIIVGQKLKLPRANDAS